MQMRRGRAFQAAKLALLGGAILAATWTTVAQFGGENQAPDLHGVWNPVIGSGAAYQIQNGDRKSEIEILIVGKEDVEGKTGYWMEIGMQTPSMGQIYTKTLMVIGENDYTVTRTIFQMPGQPPMEMPMGMSGSRGTAHETDIRRRAEHVGTEDVSTPAGTFSCEHYRDKQGQGGDVWLSTKVTPWALVKSVNGERTMVLSRVLTGEKDHITGTPQKFDPSVFMRGMGQPH